MKILLVEDTIGDPIQRVLERSGHEVHLAQSTQAARRMLRLTKFEFCLLDWVLPDGSGLSLVDDIRRDKRHSDIGILMISSRSERTDIVTAFREDIDGYVAKPFKSAQLHVKIDEIWQRRARNRARSTQIQLIIDGQAQLHWGETNPLLIFAERVSTAEGLERIQNAQVLDFLLLATTAIEAANAFVPHLNLAYYLASSTGEVSRLLNDRSTAARVAMAFVSSDCSGNCLLMARLIQLREADTCPLCVISDLNAGLKWRDRKELEASGTLVFGRRELNEYRWRDLFENHVFDKYTSGDDDDESVPDENGSGNFRRRRPGPAIAGA